MANKRKYPKVSGYWVYSISIPSVGKFYVGVSKRKKCSQRWDKSKYKGMALEPYLDEWDSMVKTVIQHNLTKEEALQFEDALIQALSRYDLCINTKRSGLIEVSDKKSYDNQYRKNNSEFRERQNQLCKQWREDNPEYMKQYYEKNKEKILEQQRQQRLKKKLEQQQNSLPLT